MSLQQNLSSPDSVLQLLESLRRIVPLGRCAVLLASIWCGRLLWSQYSILLSSNLPYYRLECPGLGGGAGLFWYGYIAWARQFLREAPARLTSFFGIGSVMVTWPVYEKFVKKADHAGELDQGELPAYMVQLLGESSILLLRAGKGQEKHHRLRSKVLSSLTPRRVLSMVPHMAIVIRDVLDRMVEDTQAHGHCTFARYAAEVPQRIIAVPIVGSLSSSLAKRFHDLTTLFIEGLVSFPINLGRFSAYGRALRARREMAGLIKDLLEHPEGRDGTVVGDLATATAEGAAFSEAELVDTVFTLLFAGQATTTEALPPLIYELARRPDWARTIADEPYRFDQVEGDTATARFVREVLRHHPPEVIIQRQNRRCPIALGDLGHVPAGYNVMACFGETMWSMGEDFDPDRWTHDVTRESFLSFGGSTPHSCVGRGLAMLELQLFARILCREYDVEVVKAERVRNWQLGGALFCFRDGLWLKLSKREGPPSVS